MRGKRKMAEASNEDKKDDSRAYFTWNLEMDRALADILRDQRSMGNKSDGAWKAVAYNTAAQMLSSRFNLQLIGENVKNHIKLWRSWYGIVSDILSQSGFDWDGTKYMISVTNEDAWNEYVKSQNDAKRFRFKVIANWDDIVDLCAKDRATGIGAETSLDADDIMSKEANEDGAYIVDIDADEQSSTTRKSKQPMEFKKGKSGEKNGIITSMNKVTESLSEFVQATRKGVKNVQEVVHDVMDELKNIPDLNATQWIKAVDWLSENPNKLEILKALPMERKKDYILAFMH
ncbi:uncharacterized protein LOC130722223 isoform X2 [Lotus japonicus]|nr:uncharacterized protein LOC130722223 isoform X2 [Lotus japonicus]XP_057428877.1 uncharacterized protein LOC130722223 isoform X2 [Lotus japonicus]XP_057428878.1 uncharacterized protein LOC130722223 isoform X2 [Lotus japonicus]